MSETRRWLRAFLIGTALAALAMTTGWASRRPGSAAEASPAGPAWSRPTWDLPIRLTPRVFYWESMLAGPRRDRMRRWLERSGRYIPMIRRELRARGMPRDLAYLPVIESGFSPDARSSAAAVGLWQFTAETGRLLGLKITPYVDERRDPVAATRAALHFLEDLHRQFGSWLLAAAAYNCGPDRVERVLRAVTGRHTGDDASYWRISPELPQETRNYVPLLIAAEEIAKNPTAYGFADLDYREPLVFDRVEVPGGTRLATVSRATGADSTLVDHLNPHYVRDVTPPGKPSIVRIPPGLRQAFATNFPLAFRAQRAADARAIARDHEPRAAARHPGRPRGHGRR